MSTTSGITAGPESIGAQLKMTVCLYICMHVCMDVRVHAYCLNAVWLRYFAFFILSKANREQNGPSSFSLWIMWDVLML